MPEVTTYTVLVYGSAAGYQTNRAQIGLAGQDGQQLAVMMFGDPGTPVEADYESGGVIRMHLPSIMFGPVVDVLRNEGPLYIHFNGSIGILGSGAEPVGEGERADSGG